MIHFTVPGDPVAKGRPRVVRDGAFTRTFTPKTTVDFENRVRFAAEHAGARPLEGPVSMTVTAMFAMPKGRFRKRAPRPAEWKTTKPDLDNLLKSVKDALNGIAYADDSQVVELHAGKIHAAQGEPARTIVTVEEIAPLSGAPRNRGLGSARGEEE
jgi:Holliday junction resolvase RusA-like endonuclease